MTSQDHKQDLARNVSVSCCAECRADTERQFVDTSVWRYERVRDYLAYIRPRLDAIRAGENSADARIWKRKFIDALNRRIGMKVSRAGGRKYCDSYLERLRGIARVNPGRTYLVRFAQRGASCLDR